MNDLESKFAQTIKQNKSTIYTVCYMFSKDADEVNDLFQEAVINMWRGFEGFENRSDVKTWNTEHPLSFSFPLGLRITF